MKKVDSRFVTMDCRAAKAARNDKGIKKGVTKWK